MFKSILEWTLVLCIIFTMIFFVMATACSKERVRELPTSNDPVLNNLVPILVEERVYGEDRVKEKGLPGLVLYSDASKITTVFGGREMTLKEVMALDPELKSGEEYKAWYDRPKKRILLNKKYMNKKIDLLIHEVNHHYGFSHGSSMTKKDKQVRELYKEKYGE